MGGGVSCYSRIDICLKPNAHHTGVDKVEKHPLQSITNSPVKKRLEESEDISLGPAKRALSLKKSPARPLKPSTETTSSEDAKEEEDCVIQ